MTIKSKRNRFTKKRNRFTKKRRGGKNNNNNCTTKCKSKFFKEVKKDKRFKVLNKISSFFGSQKKLDKELNDVLDSKNIQNDKVFKHCVKECTNKSKK